MAFIIADRVKETSTTTGTGALTLAGAMVGFQAFSDKCAVGDTVFYGIQGVDAGGAPSGEWECGLGTYSGANTLTRTTVTSSSNAGVAVTLSVGTKHVFITMPAAQVDWIRERLTAARTYYVRTDGSDSNAGLSDTAGGAFLTIQAAVNAAAEIDAGRYQITIQVADGTYAVGAVVPAMYGSLPLIIRGNNSTPSNVHVNVTGFGFTVARPTAYLQLLDMKISATVVGISASPFGRIDFGNIVFGVTGNRHINSQNYGYINAISGYSISGGAASHIQALGGGVVRIVSQTVTITGTPAFSTAFALSSEGGVAYITGNTFSGSATGVRYSATMGGVIISSGATLPGSSAGTTATGGQYN